MRMRFSILSCLLIATHCGAQGLPLFDSNDTLHLTIEAPMRTLIRNAGANADVDSQCERSASC